ncbi:hypothetical protein BKA83DRAFT_4292655, partial [Pisolithus microcarpus]
VGIAYLGHFCAIPLAFLHGGTVCSYLPGDTSFVEARSMVGEIWVFLVYRGVRGDLADISRLDGPIGMIPLSPSRFRGPLSRPTRSLLDGPLFSPTVLPHTLSTSYLPRIFAPPLAF